MKNQFVQQNTLHYLLIPLMILLILFTERFSPFMLGLLGGFTLLLFLFHSLIVEVDKKNIQVKFGPGIIKKKFPLEKVVQCEPVQLSKWESFGIRLHPDYTIYNVWGQDAVELTLNDRQKKIRIGTNEPKALCESINHLQNPASVSNAES